MTLIESLLLGLVQGLTEFLPVSSSGHLAILKQLFGIEVETGILFDILLHLGTLVAIFIVYFKDIISLIKEGFSIVWDIILNVCRFFHNVVTKEKIEYRPMVTNSYRKFVLLIIVSTIPTGIIGVVFSDLIEKASSILLIPGICLIITSGLLYIADHVKIGKKKATNATYKNALFIGVCQGIATLPGISRSGTTITACLLCGFDRKFAVKYSFIMSVPAILGAAILELKDITSVGIASSEILYYLAGMAVAAVVGYICIKTMLVIVRKQKFKGFSIYCFIIGVISIIGYFLV